MEGIGFFPFSTGQFSNSGITDISSVSNIFSYSSLDFSENPLTDLSTLPTLTSLEELDLSSTQLESLFGGKVQPQLNSFSCENTPLAELENCALMCAIVFGDSLHNVNGRKITEVARSRARFLRPRLYSLLIEGWVIETSNPLVIKNSENTVTVPESVLDKEEEIEISSLLPKKKKKKHRKKKHSHLPKPSKIKLCSELVPGNTTTDSSCTMVDTLVITTSESNEQSEDGGYFGRREKRKKEKSGYQAPALKIICYDDIDSDKTSDTFESTNTFETCTDDDKERYQDELKEAFKEEGTDISEGSFRAKESGSVREKESNASNSIKSLESGNEERESNAECGSARSRGSKKKAKKDKKKKSEDKETKKEEEERKDSETKKSEDKETKKEEEERKDSEKKKSEDKEPKKEEEERKDSETKKERISAASPRKKEHIKKRRKRKNSSTSSSKKKETIPEPYKAPPIIPVFSESSTTASDDDFQTLKSTFSVDSDSSSDAFVVKNESSATESENWKESTKTETDASTASSVNSSGKNAEKSSEKKKGSDSSADPNTKSSEKKKDKKKYKRKGKGEKKSSRRKKGKTRPLPIVPKSFSPKVIKNDNSNDDSLSSLVSDEELLNNNANKHISSDDCSNIRSEHTKRKHFVEAPPLKMVDAFAPFQGKAETHDSNALPVKKFKKKKLFFDKAVTEDEQVTEIFETDDGDGPDSDPPVFKKVDFFRLIGIEPDSGDELLSQDESTNTMNDMDFDEEFGSDNAECNVSYEELEEIREKGRKKFYQIRTIETSTKEEMEKFVSTYVKAVLKSKNRE